MISGERRCRLRQTSISARGSQRSLVCVTKADIGSAASRFISERGGAFEKKDCRQRSRRRERRKIPLVKVGALVRRNSPLSFAARSTSRRLPGASLPELLQVRLIPAKNVAVVLSDIRNAYRVSDARLGVSAITAILPQIPVSPGCGRTP